MAQTKFSGPVKSDNGFIGTVTLPTYTVATANALTPKSEGVLIYVSDGLAGAPCIAVGDGTDWISPAGTAISAV